MAAAPSPEIPSPYRFSSTRDDTPGRYPFMRYPHRGNAGCGFFRRLLAAIMILSILETSEDELMNITQATVLVTGANRGIGRAIVAALSQNGAKKIYAAARNVDTLAGFVDGARIVPIRLDVTHAQSVSDVALKARDVTLLVNNAGVLDFGNVLEAPHEAFERNFKTNFYGILAMTKAFAPIIEVNGGGAVVNVLTLVALASMPGLGVYNASKSAAWSLTQSMRADLASKGVAVHGVFPGAVDTDMLAGVDMAKTSPEEVAEAIVRGLVNSEEDIFPDPMSASIYSEWKKDHKAVERQFASM